MLTLVVLLIGYFTLSIADIKYRSVSVVHISVVAASCLVSAMGCAIYSETLDEVLLYKMLMGLAAGATVYAITYLTGAMGSADGIMLVITGAVSGWLIMLEIFVFAVTLLSIFATVLLLMHFINIKSKLPFMPFLCLSTLGVILCV